VEVAGQETAFQWMADALPMRLALDPDHDVPRRLRRHADSEPVPARHELLPDVKGAADERRVAALRESLSKAADAPAAIQVAVDDLRIAGLDARTRRVDIEVREKEVDHVVTVGGEPVAGCHALTCSPATAAEGIELVGIADDPAGKMEGHALTVDVPRTTEDLASFARGFAGIARGAGSRALILRVAPEDMERHAAAWATPADAPADADDPVLFARAAQLAVGEDLALPTVVVPAGFDPDSAFRIRVAWTPRTARVTWAQVAIDAPNGRGGPIVILARAAAAREATVVTTAAQLVAPHAATLGRGVVVGLVPHDAAVDAALSSLFRSLDDAPDVVLWVGGLADGVELAGDVPAERIASRAHAVSTCFGFGDQGSGTRLVFATGSVPGPVITAALSSFARGPKEPWPEDRLARGLALAAIALSVAP
jgi:hypothetical protein